MSEQNPLEHDETYRARLHLVGFNPDNRAVTYRSLQVPNLAEPHIEAVQSAVIVDSRENTTYQALHEVPDLFMIDFPDMSVPSRVTPAWLSHEKRSLYEQALELGEKHEAERLLHNWLDAHLRSTHVHTGTGMHHNQLELTSVSKLESQQRLPNPVAERLVAFTIGPGRKNRTPAISSLIALASKLDILPAVSQPIDSKADLQKITVFQHLVAAELLPINANYLLSSYMPNGTYVSPEGRQQFPEPNRDEVAELGRRGHEVKKDTALTKDSAFELLRMRVEASPAAPEPLVPYPHPEIRSPEQIADSRKDVNDILGSLAITSHGLPADTPEHRTYLAELEIQWAKREQNRLATKPVS